MEKDKEKIDAGKVEVWVVSNPSLNAITVPHPRPSPAEGRNDLHLDSGDYAVITDEEMLLWQLSPAFQEKVKSGRIKKERKTLDSLPGRKSDIPETLRPSQFDDWVAQQIALAPDETEDVQIARINLFRNVGEEAEWVPEADRTFIKGRLIKILIAARWYLQNAVDKRSASQNRRLKDIERQIRAIEAML